MPELLKSPAILALVLAVYVLGTSIMEGAGLMAATIFGMALTNMRIPGLAELTRIKESMVVLLVSLLFILLSADLHREVLGRLSWSLLSLTCAVIFIVRPLSIYLATIGSSLSWKERFFVGWIAPRGIVAAAVAGVAGIRLSENGVEGADLVMPAVFAVIASTMLLHGFSLRPLARRLGLTLSDVSALGIVGANTWSADLAMVVQEVGTPVIVVDTSEARVAHVREKASRSCVRKFFQKLGKKVWRKCQQIICSLLRRTQFTTGWSAHISRRISVAPERIRFLPALPVWICIMDSAGKRGARFWGSQPGTTHCSKPCINRAGASQRSRSHLKTRITCCCPVRICWCFS